MKHKLNTEQGKVACTPPYRQPHHTIQVIEDLTKELLDLEIVKECNSPWSNPIVLIWKKDNSWRFCLDLRKLNSLTLLEPVEIPRITETIDALANMKYFSLVDAKQGFFQMELEEEDKIKTAFRTRSKTLCFNRMPFGLRNASFSYQAAMNRILAPVLGKLALCYIDDIIIFSTDFQTHMSDLAEVLDLIISGGVKLSLPKCKFAQTTIDYLGYRVDGSGLRPNPDKVKSLQEFPIPKKQKNVRQFLASVGFYRQFIHDFSGISAPLSNLLRKNRKWSWGNAEQAAFDKLKSAMLSAPILKHPDFSKQFEIHTDASIESIAGVLMQKYDNIPFPIAYFSRKLHGPEVRYSVTELEALAIVTSIKSFHYYIAQSEFLVVTDHMPLKTMFSTKQNGY
jgi:hypothetical protein